MAFGLERDRILKRLESATAQGRVIDLQRVIRGAELAGFDPENDFLVKARDALDVATGRENAGRELKVAMAHLMQRKTRADEAELVSHYRRLTVALSEARLHNVASELYSTAANLLRDLESKVSEEVFARQPSLVSKSSMFSKASRQAIKVEQSARAPVLLGIPDLEEDEDPMERHESPHQSDEVPHQNDARDGSDSAVSDTAVQPQVMEHSEVPHQNGTQDSQNSSVSGAEVQPQVATELVKDGSPLADPGAQGARSAAPESGSGGGSGGRAFLRVVIQCCTQAQLLLDPATETQAGIGHGLVLFVSFPRGREERGDDAAEALAMRRAARSLLLAPLAYWVEGSNALGGRVWKSVVELCRQGEAQGLLVLPEASVSADLEEAFAGQQNESGEPLGRLLCLFAEALGDVAIELLSESSGERDGQTVGQTRGDLQVQGSSARDRQQAPSLVERWSAANLVQSLYARHAAHSQSPLSPEEVKASRSVGPQLGAWRGAAETPPKLPEGACAPDVRYGVFQAFHGFKLTSVEVGTRTLVF